MPNRSQIFVSYSHKDSKLLEEFKTMLAPVIRNGLVNLWDDTKIQVGANWKNDIQEALAATRIAVLLVSQNFLASSFIANDELPPLLKAAKEEGATIFWICLSSCLWQETEIGSYQAAHDISRPLDRLTKSQRQAVLSNICAKLVKIAQTPITGEIPQHPPLVPLQGQSRRSSTASLTGLDRSALRFGLTLGWQLGRYELIYDSPIPEAKALQPSLEAEIKDLLTADGYPQSIAGLTFQQLIRQVLAFYGLTSINKHAAILIGNSACRASLIGASKDQGHNDEMKALAFSSLRDIDPTILRNKEKFFDLLLQRKPHSIVEVLEVIDSFTD